MFSFAFLKNSVWTYFVVSENFPVNKVFIMWTFKWMTNSLRYEYAILCGFFEKLRGNFKIENMKASRFSKILVWILCQYQRRSLKRYGTRLLSLVLSLITSSIWYMKYMHSLKCLFSKDGTSSIFLNVNLLTLFQWRYLCSA